MVVFSFNGIDTMTREDRSPVLAEVSRVPRPGGSFLLRALAPHARLRRREVFGDRWLIVNDEAHDYHYWCRKRG